MTFIFPQRMKIYRFMSLKLLFWNFRWAVFGTTESQVAKVYWKLRGITESLWNKVNGLCQILLLLKAFAPGTVGALLALPALSVNLRQRLSKKNFLNICLHTNFTSTEILPKFCPSSLLIHELISIWLWKVICKQKLKVFPFYGYRI